MLSKEITDLLTIEYRGLFNDQEHCLSLLADKRDSGDLDTPRDLIDKPIFDLSPGLFIWITQKHLQHDSGHLVARDVMSNISVAGLSGSYGEIVDMLAEAGLEDRAAQIWRADVASHMDVFRDHLRAHKAVARYEDLPEDKRTAAAPDRFQRKMAQVFPAKKQSARDAIDAFENWVSKYEIEERHRDQIDRWKEELESNVKHKLPPSDKSPMSLALFWEIIADAQSGSESETILRIEDRMTNYTAKAVRDAAKLAQDCLTEACREDVWALAYVLQDGCSDDAFEDFRNWMMLKGQAMFEGIMAGPDLFDPGAIDGADFGAAGGLMSAFENAYMSRAGKPLILPRRKTVKFDPDETRFTALVPTVRASLAKP